MPIVVPGRRLGTAYASSVSAAKKKMTRGKKSTNASLMLTPMIDMFVIIVLYLMQSFSSSGQILFIDPALKLPDAIRAVELFGNPPVITIAEHEPQFARAALRNRSLGVEDARDLE